MAGLGKHVPAKLEEGDFKGAVCLACSKSTIVDISDATFEAYRSIHLLIMTLVFHLWVGGHLSVITAVAEEEIINAIRSFPNNSAGGPDSL